MNIDQVTTALRTAVSSLHKTLRKGSLVTSYSMTELETVSLILRHKSLLPTELAALTRITTQSMSQILKKMEEQGIIMRTPSLDDKRKVFVSITEHGKQIVETMRYNKDEQLKALIAQLTTAEKEALEKAIPALNKLIELQNN